jgi:hypothetical protein
MITALVQSISPGRMFVEIICRMKFATLLLLQPWKREWQTICGYFPYADMSDYLQSFKVPRGYVLTLKILGALPI